MSNATPMKEHPFDAAQREVLEVAAGRSRPDIEARASQAFDWANECRARYTSAIDLEKRGQATARARRWASILRHMDATEADVFDADEYQADATAGRLRTLFCRVTSLLDVPGWIEAYREMTGSDPIEFYVKPD